LLLCQEIEEEIELKPGLEDIGKQIMEHLLKLGPENRGITSADIKNRNLKDNPLAFGIGGTRRSVSIMSATSSCCRWRFRENARRAGSACVGRFRQQ
jgi:hypothetical protein